MAKRIITSIIGLPLLVFSVITGGIFLKLVIMALSIIGMWELYMAVSKSILPIHYISYGVVIIYFCLLPNFTLIQILVLESVYMISTLLCLVIFHKKINMIDCAVSIFGFFYIAFLMSFIYMVHAYQNYGNLLIWLIFISAWGCDTFAYFTGMILGKHSLTKLSPKKTVEGAIGGVIGAFLLAFFYGLTLNAVLSLDSQRFIWYCAVTGGIGAVFSQFGDLSASAIKRYTGIKDYGHIFPGHGGVLDRFDSVLFTAPGVYLGIFLLM